MASTEMWSRAAILINASVGPQLKRFRCLGWIRSHRKSSRIWCTPPAARRARSFVALMLVCFHPRLVSTPMVIGGGGGIVVVVVVGGLVVDVVSTLVVDVASVEVVDGGVEVDVVESAAPVTAILVGEVEEVGTAPASVDEISATAPIATTQAP